MLASFGKSPHKHTHRHRHTHAHTLSCEQCVNISFGLCLSGLQDPVPQRAPKRRPPRSPPRQCSPRSNKVTTKSLSLSLYFFFTVSIYLSVSISGSFLFPHSREKSWCKSAKQHEKSPFTMAARHTASLGCTGNLWGKCVHAHTRTPLTHT